MGSGSFYTGTVSLFPLTRSERTCAIRRFVFPQTKIAMRFRILVTVTLPSLVAALSTPVATISNPPIAGTNHIFEFLKWGGSQPDFDVMERTKEYTSTFERTGSIPDESWYHRDYVLRGPVIGPINLRDLRATQDGIQLMQAFPDFKVETFGHTIDPENPYRCFYFQRWRATHTAPLVVNGQTYEATGKSAETPVTVFSVVWTPERNIIYEQVGAVVDR
jgi:hypothetical protein